MIKDPSHGAAKPLPLPELSEENMAKAKEAEAEYQEFAKPNNKPTMAEATSNFVVLFDEKVKRVREDGRNVKMVWGTSWYDGPATGIVWYDNQNCWFRRINPCYMDLELRDPLYLICNITQEEYDEERRRQGLFRTHVGMHTDFYYTFDDNGTSTRRRRTNDDDHVQDGESYFSIREKEKWYNTDIRMNDRQVLAWWGGDPDYGE